MRYFDKSFFKFTFGFLAIVCLSLVLMALASNFIEGDESQTAQIQPILNE